MKRRIYLSLVVVALAVASGFGQPTARGEDSAKVKAARELLAAWSGGRNAAVVKRSTDEVRAAMDADKLAQAWASAEFQHGKYVSELSAEEKPAGEYTAVLFSLKFERAILKIRFVLDSSDRLAGLWFDAVEKLPDDRTPPYAPRDRFREEQVTLKCGDYELPAILTLPAGGDPKKLPAAVFVHGSGPHDADESIGPNKPFRDLAWGLATKGIATLRYQKRTQKYGQSMKPENLTLDWEAIDDACAAANLLRGRAEVDADRIFVIGHSLGGFVAPFIAQRDGRLAGIVQIAANARPITDLVIDQLNYLFNLDGTLSDDEKKQLADAEQAIAAIRSGKAATSQPLLGAPGAYWADIQAHDNVTALEKLTLPALLIHGGRDYQVSDQDWELWKKRVGDKPNVTIRRFESLSHLMIPGEGKPSPAEYQKAGFVDESVVKEIAEWMLRKPGGKP
ncbi:MAG: alpha/beta fold hydrolase [Planctomycetes bacterium]|nr:alpha/beta fold hydrolase [Planctomycetota bacterium]